MKTMKCKSCGANLKFNENDQYATCPYCKTKYKVSDNIKISIDDNTKEIFNKGFKIFKGTSLAVAIIGFIVFIIIVVVMINIFRGTDDNDNKIIDDKTQNTQEKFSKAAFNSIYEMNSGTQSKIFIETVLDTASINNKKNKDLLITVIYNQNNTTDSDEIINIKHELKNTKKYEVKLDYNEDGYVNKITIEDLGN